ncbi:phage major capsid protein [Bacillus sp. sid0103]|uniref:phage major capsid protein n=1 Tax=Bacillus sp. sid0103 TaxID=2856337 RepID=UPI001C445B31|nr:phage major capsid protein [Bacillus sp. sid0103]MBV7509625.1 phage major capsid protein [Bacillus sp. sid0103]
MNKIELRIHDAKLVSENQDEMIVSGYANKTDQLSEVLGSSQRFREKIAKGAFQRAINKKKDIDFLLEHKSDQILASTRNDSLKLEEDSVGLKITAKIVPTSWGKDSYALIKSGILRNMSFGFKVVKDSWKKTAEDIYERTVSELELFEVSVVKNPAYAQSSIAARSIEIIENPEITEVQEIRVVKPRNISKEIRDLELSIAKQKETISSLEISAPQSTNPDSYRFQIDLQKKALGQKEQEVSDLKQELRKQEENKMNEERALQVTANGVSVQELQVDNIVKKAESTSSVFTKARKVPFTGSELKVPYESSLDDADFLDENQSATELALNLSNFADLKKRRVAKSIAMSKQVVHDSGVDLSQHAQELVARRVVKRIEKSIIAGTAANEFKGIAPDTSVVSKNMSLAASSVIVELRKVYLAVHEDFVGNSSWYMSRAFFEKVATFQDADGNHFVKSITVNGKVIPTLFGHEIEITSALADGTTAGQIPVLFGSIEDCYTIGVAKELEGKEVANDTINALRGSVTFSAEFLGDGRVTNYQAVAKGTVVA